MKTIAHIINHTHWDREWFLTSAYTNQWIPDLINKLEELVAENPNFTFLLDGQTLVIEDLLAIAPGYESKIDRLVTDGNLIIGPYYCQPDWRLTGGEALLRNLLYGWQDAQTYGGGDRADIGWLVDIFGHISQAPQLHRLFNVNTAFIWRGIPRLEPYFSWQGADGGALFTVNLFGGYRNLYGVTRTSKIAVKRLVAETTKLQPFYPTGDIPLFDGYDLEQNPEDPIRFFQQKASEIPENILIKESSPHQFASALQNKLLNLPVISGELNSGKYGATFPGTLSTRTYLKIMRRDCEYLLYSLCEPLAVMAQWKGKDYPTLQYKTWGRKLLQNTVHDCICGVSIDQVHEKMELSYRKLFQAAKRDIQDSLDYIMKGFSSGNYAVSTNPFEYEGWLLDHDCVYRVQTNGVGVWKIGLPEPFTGPSQAVESFTWQNVHYSATIKPDGTVQIENQKLGYLVVTEEHGDTYSSEEGDLLGRCKAIGPLIIERENPHCCVVRYECSLQGKEVFISATIRIIFDQTPILRLQVDLDTRGTNFRVDMNFETTPLGEIYAGMPFDLVKRPKVDRDLLPRNLDPSLAKVLLGQRELKEVHTFPFQDFVAISDDLTSVVVFSRGGNAYQVSDHGTISLTLRRSVEWLTAPNLEHRAGDAGPYMYVPDARCERLVQHELAVMVSKTTIHSTTIQQCNAGFQNPPVILNTQGSGEQTSCQILRADLPLSSLHIYNQRVLARLYNPTPRPQSLCKKYLKTDVWGNPKTWISELAAKEIATIDITDMPVVSVKPGKQLVTPVLWPSWRIGENHSSPDPQIIAQLESMIAQIETQLSQVEDEIHQAGKKDHYHLKHTYYVLKRKQSELQLSRLLNQKRLTLPKNLISEHLYNVDPELARLGLKLNELRIKRRIYDYIVEALPKQAKDS